MVASFRRTIVSSDDNLFLGGSGQQRHPSEVVIRRCRAEEAAAAAAATTASSAQRLNGGNYISPQRPPPPPPLLVHLRLLCGTVNWQSHTFSLYYVYLSLAASIHGPHGQRHGVCVALLGKPTERVEAQKEAETNGNRSSRSCSSGSSHREQRMHKNCNCPGCN